MTLIIVLAIISYSGIGGVAVMVFAETIPRVEGRHEPIMRLLRGDDNNMGSVYLATLFYFMAIMAWPLLCALVDRYYV